METRIRSITTQIGLGGKPKTLYFPEVKAEGLQKMFKEWLSIEVNTYQHGDPDYSTDNLDKAKAAIDDYISKRVVVNQEIIKYP